MASISSSSSATVRVEKATSEFLIGPDWTLNIDICDAINSNQMYVYVCVYEDIYMFFCVYCVNFLVFMQSWLLSHYLLLGYLVLLGKKNEFYGFGCFLWIWLFMKWCLCSCRHVDYWFCVFYFVFLFSLESQFGCIKPISWFKVYVTVEWWSRKEKVGRYYLFWNFLVLGE